jgi:WD40 repeat protein
LTACADGYASVWEVAGGRGVCRSPKHGGAVSSAVFSADGQRFVTASEDRIARICDASTGKELVTLKHPVAVRHAAFNPDGRRVLTVTDQAARLWDAASGSPIGPELHHEGKVLTAAFSRKGDLLVTGGGDNLARVWQVANGREPSLEHILKHLSAVVVARFSPDGEQLATGCEDGTVNLWVVASGERLHRLQQRDKTNDVSFSPDGRFLVTGCDSSTAVVWDLASGAPWTHEKGAPSDIICVKFSPEGRSILAAAEADVVQLWQPIHAYREHHPVPRDDRRFSSTRSKDGRWEAISADAFTLRVRDTTTGEPVGPPITPGGTILSAAFDPAGSRLLTTTREGDVQIWAPATGQHRAGPLAHAGAVLSGAFSPDGRLVVTCSDDNTCRVWDAATGVPITPFMKHPSTPYQAVFSPDSRCLLTACENGTDRLWDASSGERLSPPLDPDGWPKQVFASLGAADSWNLPVDDRPIEELVVEAQWASGNSIDENGGLVPILPKQLQSLEESIETRYPGLLERSP